VHHCSSRTNVLAIYLSLRNEYHVGGVSKQNITAMWCGILCRKERSSFALFGFGVESLVKKEWRHILIGTNSDRGRLRALEFGVEV
jgi:hypothetical protein